MLIQYGLMQESPKIRNRVLPTETTLASKMELRANSENSNNRSITTQANVSANGHNRSNGNDVGCKGLRSKRYISDGFCRTLKPISEVLCTGYCVPERYQPWYPEFMQVWGKTKVLEYRCVDGVTRHQKIKLMCDNGQMRSYQVRVVKSCACRKQVRPPYGNRANSQQDGGGGGGGGGGDTAAAVASMRTTAPRRDRHPKNSKTRQTLSNA